MNDLSKIVASDRENSRQAPAIGVLSSLLIVVADRS
jgi:hypothetical protein